MCTSILHNGNDTLVGFNFDTKDLKYKITMRHNLFFISILYNGRWEPYFGVNCDGTFVNELQTAFCQEGKYRRSPSCYRLDLLVWNLLTGKDSIEYIVSLLSQKMIVSVPNVPLHSHITTKDGHVLIIDPGRGSTYDHPKYSVLTNFSVYDKDNTCNLPGAGLDRYEKAENMLRQADDDFSVQDAFTILQETSQKGDYKTVFSMVYSANENKVYYTEEQNFDSIKEHKFL